MITKELRTLKNGELKGQFTAWCAQELEFSYEWARILMNAYSRYELSEFTDKPQDNIRLYAKTENEKHNSSCVSEHETEENTMKDKNPKEDSVKVMSKIDVWCDEQELEFTYEWANVLIRAYSRYELSGYKDQPQLSIEQYAKNGDEKVKSTSLSEDETEENTMKEKNPKNILLKSCLKSTYGVMNRGWMIYKRMWPKLGMRFQKNL